MIPISHWPNVRSSRTTLVKGHSLSHQPPTAINVSLCTGGNPFVGVHPEGSLLGHSLGGHFWVMAVGQVLGLGLCQYTMMVVWLVLITTRTKAWGSERLCLVSKCFINIKNFFFLTRRISFTPSPLHGILINNT